MEKKYKAFISYSRKDEKFTKKLHTTLEEYQIPKELYEKYPSVPEKLSPIFRDIEQLIAGDKLASEIFKKLQNSENLIVVCSPHSAKSEWVNKEIIDFKMMYGEDRIFPIIIEGTPNSNDENECFPEALKYEIDENGKITKRKTHILASNIIKNADGKEFAKVKLIAGILGIENDDLWNFEEKRLSKKRRFWGSVWGVIFLMMVGLTVFSWIQREEAIEQKMIADNKTKEANEAEKQAKKSEEVATAQTKIATSEKHEAEKQLIIAKQKTQSLSILTTKTIEALALTKEKILEKYLKDITNSGEREIFIEMLRPLIANTESMVQDEKGYWSNILPSLNNKQLSKLAKILIVELQKLHNFVTKKGKGYQTFYSSIKMFQKNAHNKCFNKKIPYQCLKSAYLCLEYSNAFDKNQSVETYFKAYRKLVDTPSSFYFNVYSKYLRKLGQMKKALKYTQKAILMEPNNIDNLRNLITYYVEDHNMTQALNIQQNIVLLRKKDYFKFKKNITNEKESKFEKNRKLFTYISALNNLFAMQYEINSTIIVDRLYPMYKKDIISLENSNSLSNTADSVITNSYEDYLDILYYIAKSYGNKKQYKNAILFLEKILKIYNKNKIKASWVANKIISLTWYQLLTKDYDGAIKNSRIGIQLDINKAVLLETNLAHAYLLSGDYQNAKIIYLMNKGKKVNDKELWEDIILKDFEDLRKEGIKSENFKKIEKLLKNSK